MPVNRKFVIIVLLGYFATILVLLGLATGLMIGGGCAAETKYEKRSRFEQDQDTCLSYMRISECRPGFESPSAMCSRQMSQSDLIYKTCMEEHGWLRDAGQEKILHEHI